MANNLQLDLFFGTTKILYPIAPTSTLNQLYQGLLDPLQFAEDLPHDPPTAKDELRICRRVEIEDGVFKFVPLKEPASSPVNTVFSSKPGEALFLQFKVDGAWQPISATLPTIDDADSMPEPFEDEVMSD